MSSSLNCLYVEIERDKWYWVLERSNAPKNSWDWRDYADCCGPFESKDAANEHLHENNSNPGGCEVERLVDGMESRDLSKDAVLARLILRAEKPIKTRNFNGFCRKF